MKIKHTIQLSLICVLYAYSISACTSSKTPEYVQTIVWDKSEGDVEGYRIPGIVVTSKGTALAFAEARIDYHDHTPNHIVLKRSTDGGLSWSPSIYIEESNGNYWATHTEGIDKNDNSHKKEVWTNIAPIVDSQTGRIFFFYALNEGGIAEMNLQRYTKVFYKYSDDDGLTWTERKEVTHLLNAREDGGSYLDNQNKPVVDSNGFPCDYLGRAFHMPGPGHGIQLQSGRLLLQVWNRTALAQMDKTGQYISIPIKDRKYGVCTLYSDDHGETWHYGSAFGEEVFMNESRIIELDNGDVYMNARYTLPEKNSHRATAISHDGGIHWTDIKIDSLFPLSNQCDAGLTKITDPENHKTYLLYSKNESTEGRKNLTIRLSEDNGKTWPVSKTVTSSTASYSDLAVLPDNTILVLYETGKYKPVHCVRINLEWIFEKNKKQRR